MVCLYCSSTTKVTNSRPQKRANQVWRRRQCTQCKAIVSTIEYIELTTAISVASNSKPLKAFDSFKLQVSIYSSLKHRKSASMDAQELFATILKLITAQSSNGSIKKEQIANITYQVLSRFDNAAATHYKAFHATSN